MNKNEIAYWMSLASMRNIKTKRKNALYEECKTKNRSIIDLFEDESLWPELGITEEEKILFLEAKQNLVSASILAEDMIDQRYDIIPICDQENYPERLKKNLGGNAPLVIYTRGDKELLKRHSIAIVGSRNATPRSIEFTRHVAQNAAKENKLVVSGNAKGVDTEALYTAIEAGGTSIVVLPQGICTFTGFNKFHKHISARKILVMSAFQPNAPWQVELAMARNPLIYALAEEIYVAQSDANKGGTWAGVIDGIRQGRKENIYVRDPEMGEENGNKLLIQKGTIPVDFKGQRKDIQSVAEPDGQYRLGL